MRWSYHEGHVRLTAFWKDYKKWRTLTNVLWANSIEVFSMPRDLTASTFLLCWCRHDAFSFRYRGNREWTHRHFRSDEWSWLVPILPFMSSSNLLTPPSPRHGSENTRRAFGHDRGGDERSGGRDDISDHGVGEGSLLCDLWVLPLLEIHFLLLQLLSRKLFPLFLPQIHLPSHAVTHCSLRCGVFSTINLARLFFFWGFWIRSLFFAHFLGSNKGVIGFVGYPWMDKYSFYSQKAMRNIHKSVSNF